MKKILSLLALLMTTVAAMAFDYTDVRSASEDGQPYYDVTDAKLTITPNDDGTYNVTFHTLQAKYGSTVDDFGTFEYKNLSGTTTDGITVIEGSNLTGYVTLVEAGNPTEGTLYVKFTETKAYATLETQTQTYNAYLSVKYGTDEGWGSDTPVVEEYPINFDKDATHSRNDRITSSISLQQEGKEKQTISTTPYKLYEDLTAQSFTVEAGSELTATFGFNGIWMHGYVYIDLDNNKQFSWNAEGTDQSGTELVTYSYYKDYNSDGESASADVNVNPPSFTAPTVPGTYRIRYKIDWDNVDPGGNGTSSNYIGSNGGGIWDATLVVEEAQTPTPTVVAEKTFTDAISMVGDDFSTELGEATVTVKEMSDETVNMTLSVTTTEGTTEYTASGFTKTVDTDKNRTTYAGTLNIEGEDFNVNALVYTENEVEKLYMVATSYYKYVIGTDPDYVAPVTEVSNKNYTSNLRIYDADAVEPVNVVEKDEAVVNIVKNSDDTYKVTLKDIAWGEHAATDLVFVGSADAGIMSDKLDGEEETEQGVSIMAVPDDATAAVLGEGTQAMFQWIEKAEDAIEMAFYLQVGTTTYAGEFNYEKETPDTPEITKVVEDGYAPAGDKFSFPFTCDFATQKLVWKVDFTNAGYTPNQLVFTIGTSDADLSAWNTTTGGNAHFYFTKSTTGNKLVLHYLSNGTRIDVDNIAVDDVAKFSLDAEGFHVGDVLAVSAEQMPKLYEGGKDFLFGSQEGNGRSNAVYNYVMVVPLDWTEPTSPFEAVTKTTTDVAYTTYNGTTTNYDANTVEVTEYEQDKYKVTYKDLTVGNTRLGDLTIDGVTATVGEDNVVTLSTEATEATWSNVSDNQIVLTLIPNETSAISNFAATLVPGTEDNTIEKLNLTVNVTLGGEEAKVVFGEQYVPELPEPTVYTDQAKTSYYGDAEYTDKVVNVYDLGENKYKVVYKEYNLGSSTKFDLVYNNVEGTTDEDGYTTYTFDGKATAENVTIESGVIASVNEGDEVDATLNGKSKDGKLYATFTMSVMGGTSTTVYGTEFPTPEDPDEEYTVNFDKDAQNNHASRRTSSVSLQQEGKDVQTLTFNSSLNGYEDHSADEPFTVEAGSEVATTFGYNGEWMHGYVYIDLDNNKQFDVNADDLDNSPELVAYSYYSGLNSDGESVDNNVNVTPPTFTAPATPGTYRIRFKIDWDNVDPGGCVDSGNHILNNGGGVWDATLVVTEQVVDGINAINAAVAEGNAEIFTVNGAKVNKLQKGVNLVRTADGKVKKVLVK